MPYIVECPNGVESFTESSVVCNPDIGNSVSVLPDIGEAEIAALLAGALYILVAAWGWRIVGDLIFRRN